MRKLRIKKGKFESVIKKHRKGREKEGKSYGVCYMHSIDCNFIFINFSAGAAVKTKWVMKFLCGQQSGLQWHCSSCKSTSQTAGHHPHILSHEESALVLDKQTMSCLSGAPLRQSACCLIALALKIQSLHIVNLHKIIFTFSSPKILVLRMCLQL